MTFGCAPKRAEVAGTLLQRLPNLFSCEALTSRSFTSLLLELARKSGPARKSRRPRADDRRLRFVGDLTAGDPPVPIPNTEVKPRRADCTARESVWESRSLPA